MAEKIFINYRRETDRATAGRLHDQLEAAFAKDGAFIDVDGFRPGMDFVVALSKRVAECDVFLAIIGPDWVDVKDRDGSRRLENPEDWVRVEIESALEQGKYVVPVLVDGAEMPSRHKLPESLAPLARQHAAQIRHDRFRADVQQGLIGPIREYREEARGTEERRRQELERLAEEEKRRLASEAKAREQEEARKAQEARGAEIRALVARAQSAAVAKKPSNLMLVLSLFVLTLIVVAFFISKNEARCDDYHGSYRPVLCRF